MSFFKTCFRMHIIFLAVFLTVCGTEKLDRRYLPPPLSAKSAGGELKDLLTPFPSPNQNTRMNAPIISNDNHQVPQNRNYEGKSEQNLNNKYRFASEPFGINNNKGQPNEQFDDNKYQTPSRLPNKISLPSKNNLRSFQDTQPTPKDSNLQTYENEGKSNYNSLKPSQIDLNRSDPYRNQNSQFLNSNRQQALAGFPQDLNSNYDGRHRIPLPSQTNQQFDNRVISPKQSIFSSKAFQDFNGFPVQQSFSQNDNKNYDKNYSGSIPTHTNENNKDTVRPQSAQERSAEILQLENEINDDGFHFSFETNNGLKAESNGFTSNGVQAQGGYSYIGDDGEIYSIRYTADEGGFQPFGDHLPTPPPIPEAILRSLEQNFRDEAAGIEDDGMYDPSKYGDDQYFNPQYTSTSDNYDSRNNIRSKQANVYDNPQYSQTKIQSPINFDASSRQSLHQGDPNSRPNGQLRDMGTANKRLPSIAFKQSSLKPISQQTKGKIATSEENSEKQIIQSFPSTDTRKTKQEFNQITKDFDQDSRSFDKALSINNRRLPKGPEYLPPKQAFNRPQNVNQPLHEFNQNPTQQDQSSSFTRLKSPQKGSQNNYDRSLNSELVEYDKQPIKSEKQVPNYVTNLNRPSHEYNEELPNNENTQKLRIPSQISQPSTSDRFYFNSNVNNEQTRDNVCRNQACSPNYYSESSENDYKVRQPNQSSLDGQNSMTTDTNKNFLGSNSLTVNTQPPSEARNKHNEIYNYLLPGQQDSSEQYRNEPTDLENSQYQESGLSSDPSEFSPLESNQSQLSSQSPENTYIENQQLQDSPQTSFFPRNNNKQNLKPQQVPIFHQDPEPTQENNYSNDNLNQYPYEKRKEEKNYENGFMRPLSEQAYYPFSDAPRTENDGQNDRVQAPVANQKPYEEPALRPQPDQHKTSDFYASQLNNRNQQSASQKHKPQYQDQRQYQRYSYQPQQTTPQQSYSFSTTELNSEGTEVPTQQYDGELYQYNKPDPVSPESQNTTDSTDSTTPTANIINVTNPDTQSTQTIQLSQTNRNFVPSQDRHEEFPRFRQPPRFDDETGYHY